jgi:hypothetical protein
MSARQLLLIAAAVLLGVRAVLRRDIGWAAACLIVLAYVV